MNPLSPRIVYINSMKKLLLLSAILLGAATASQAGVRINLGFGFPLPLPPVVAPAPVYQAPVYQAPCPPVYDYYSPSVVVSPPPLYFGYGHRYGYYPYRHYYYGPRYYSHHHYRRW